MRSFLCVICLGVLCLSAAHARASTAGASGRVSVPSSDGVALAADAGPGWTANGRPVCTAPRDQVDLSAVSDGADGTLIAWADYRAGFPRVFVQRVLADGEIAPGWPLDGVGVSAGSTFLQGPVAVPDGSGGLFVVWVEGTSGHVCRAFVQRLDRAGNVAPAWPSGGLRVSAATSNQYMPCAATDDSGGVYVVWEDDRDGGSDVYVQRILGDGSRCPGWDSTGVRMVTESGYKYGVVACADGKGGVIAAWTDGLRIAAMRMTRAGRAAPGWPAEGVMVRSDTTYCVSAQVASDSSGGGFVAWLDSRTEPAQLYAQRVEAGGAVAPGWPEGGRAVALSTREQGYESICADEAGGAYVAWLELDSFGYLYATRLTGAGDIAAGWPAQGLQVRAQWEVSGPVVLPGPDHGCSLLWSEMAYLAPTGEDLLGTRLGPDGSQVPGWPAGGTVICNAPGYQVGPVAVPTGDGFIVAWCDGRNGSTYDVYAARVGDDGVVPTRLALVEATAEPERVRLRWYGADGSFGAATVQRRTVSTDWIERGDVTADGDGFLSFEDGDVRPGARYAYRLRIVAGGAESFTTETWVDVPATLELAVAATTNPTTGPLTVAFTLPARSAAGLELLDVSGRTLVSRDVTPLGPGRHVLPLGEAGALSPGVYWLRLTQGGRSVSSRCVVLR